MRYLFFLFIAIMILFTILQERGMKHDSVKPQFLIVDTIADSHQTQIITKVHSPYKPNKAQLKAFEADYSNIWSHLNNLYATNDVEAGKEYYTEAWFKQVCRFYKGVQTIKITREDVKHELHVMNWSSDALVCNAIDSNVVFKYTYPDKTQKTTTSNIAIVLLLQGDHWRIDAIRMINETIINNKKN